VAVLVNLAAILQPAFEPPPLPPPEPPALAAMLADTIPDFRRSTDPFVPESPSETALLARSDDRSGRVDGRFERRDYRQDPRPAPRLDVRRDFRPDDRPTSRQDFRGAPAARSVSRNNSCHDDPRTSRQDSRLDDSRDSAADDDISTTAIKESMQTLQKLCARRERQDRHSQPSSSARTAFMTQTDDSPQIAYNTVMYDDDDYPDRLPPWISSPQPL
jgi:hypothetical protein